MSARLVCECTKCANKERCVSTRWIEYEYKYVRAECYSRSGPLCSYKRGAGGGLACHARGLVISGPSTGLAPYSRYDRRWTDSTDIKFALLLSSRRMLKMALSMVPSTRLRIVAHCWGERPEQDADAAVPDGNRAYVQAGVMESDPYSGPK